MYRKGELVRHASMPSWGIGSIMHAPRGGNLRIRFEQGGEKLIHPSHAELTKVPEDDLLYLVIRRVRFRWGRPVETVRVIPVVKQT
jgi:hypothetical protein